MTAKPINFINLTDWIKACNSITPKEVKRNRIKHAEKISQEIDQILLVDRIEEAAKQKQNTSIKHLIIWQTLSQSHLQNIKRYKPIPINCK